LDDYVEIADSPSLRFGTGDFSLEAWVKTADAVGGIIKKAGEGYYCYSLIVYDHRARAHLYNGIDCYVNSDIVVDDNKWHHIVGVFDRDSYIKIYVDGACHGTWEGDSSADMQTTREVRIGDDYLAPEEARYLDGIIDEVRIYNRALTEEEIKASYHSGNNTLLSIGAIHISNIQADNITL